MAYQVKRKKLYTEELELVDESGKVVHTLHVALDPDSMARKLSEKHTALVKAFEEVQGEPGMAPEIGLETLGNVVVDILEAVFGAEDTEVIVNFYSGRYLEMTQEVIPFVTSVVIPQIRKLAQENRREVAAGYGRGRKRK